MMRRFLNQEKKGFRIQKLDSEFNTLPSPKQIYAIQRYLKKGMYPYFMVVSVFRSTRNEETSGGW